MKLEKYTKNSKKICTICHKATVCYNDIAVELNEQLEYCPIKKHDNAMMLKLSLCEDCAKIIKHKIINSLALNTSQIELKEILRGISTSK